MTLPRPLPDTIAEYERQVDDAMRTLVVSSRDYVPVPDFQKISRAYYAKKPVHVLAMELMDDARQAVKEPEAPETGPIQPPSDGQSLLF